MKFKVPAITIVLAMVMPGFTLAQESDSTLADVINRGTFTGRTRSFFMSTINQGNLSDYYAVAIGAGLGYESPEIRKFKLAISGFFVYNAASGDLTKPDPVTDMMNRYEIGLFDITDPANRNAIHRVEQLYLQYRFNKSFVRTGKMNLKTPFINAQDGRMGSTLEQGIWTEINELRNTNLQAGWINEISPRSTTNWFSVQSSIGVYPGGLNDVGSKSAYTGNVQSRGIAMLGIDHRQKDWSVSAWDTWIENVSNTMFFQLERQIKYETQQYYGGIQFVRQHVLGNGGHEDPEKTYMRPGTLTNTWSSRIGWRNGGFDINLNGTFISDGGRFLMPREWGRDPFYTFLPRERNEGFGSLKAYSLNVQYAIPKTSWKTSAGIGDYQLPDVNNFRLNKYAMPSYRQFNVDINYRFGNFLKGADVQFLYVYKQGTGPDYENPKNILNKVNMSNINFVFNYRFESSHRFRQK